MIKTIILFSCICLTAPSVFATAQQLDTEQIERLTGAKGELDKENNVFKVSVPRPELKVIAAGVKLTPALGLTSWASFKPLNSEAEVMGDLVLLEDQINPVMQNALDQGLQVTALHNHYLWDDPKIMFMHIEGKGDVKTLATAIGEIFKTIQTTTNGRAWKGVRGNINPGKSTFTSKKLDEILGKEGTLKNGVYKVVWGRTTHMHGQDLTASMGVNTWAAFAGGDKNAVVLGDIAMEEKDVQNVLKLLLKNNIYIVSLHQHMMGEAPKIMFVHYMGRGPVLELAKAIKEIVTETTN